MIPQIIELFYFRWSVFFIPSLPFSLVSLKQLISSHILDFILSYLKHQIQSCFKGLVKGT